MRSHAKLVLSGLLAALLLSPVLVAQTVAAPDADPPTTSKPSPEKRPPTYDESADARQQIAEALVRAKKDNRRVLIQWGANWCHWCHLLHDHFKSDKAVARKLMYEYDVVLVDIGHMDKNMDLVNGYGAELRGVPYLTVLDADGEVVVNQLTDVLEKAVGDGDPGHDGAKALAFLTDHQAPYLSAESVLSSGLERAAKEDKVVFLHFGAPWCGWCHRLEDWMARAEVARVLGREFVDVKIDVDRTIGGKELMARSQEGGGIPWFAFLRPDGKIIMDSDDGGSNIGCPHSDEEIAAFRRMLGEVSRKLTAQDIERVTALLGPKKDG